MQQPEDQPNSVAQRLIEALTGAQRSPQAVLDEYRELRAWDPDRLESLMQAFDAAHAAQRLPDSVRATVRDSLRRWGRDARNGATDRTPVLPDPGDWTEEMPPPDAAKQTGEFAAAVATSAWHRPVVPPAVAHDVGRTADVVVQPQIDPAPGTVLLGRYELGDPLGSGGTAVVFHARDRRRDVDDGELQHLAIKTPRPDTPNRDRAVARLKREFRQTQLLPHPNIVRMFDLDCDHGLWFITMERLDGESLARRLQRVAPEALPVHEVWPVVRTCAQALAFAHGRGIVHGDFKPSNVMITADGEAHLLDFGAAPDLSTSGEPGADEDGRTLATRCYASPEALAGEPPDARDDVFSFACVVYEMLAGSHPFERRAADAARHANARPATISGLGTRQFEALARGLAWRREDRPFGVLQLLDELQHPPDTAVGDVAAPAGDETPAKASAPHASGTAPAPAHVPGALENQAPHAAKIDGRHRMHIAFGALLLLTVTLFFHGWRDSLVSPAPAQRAGAGSTLPSPPPAAAPAVPGAFEPGRADAPESPAIPDVGARPTEEQRPMRAAGPHNTARGAASRATGTDKAPTAAVPATRAPARRVSLDAAEVQVSEGAFAAVITLRRQGDPRGVVPVRWRIDGGSAQPGRDFAAPTQGTARFASGQTVRTLYVPLIDDHEREGPESFGVRVTPASRAAAPGAVTHAVVTINDDD